MEKTNEEILLKITELKSKISELKNQIKKNKELEEELDSFDKEFLGRFRNRLKNIIPTTHEIVEFIEVPSKLISFKLLFKYLPTKDYLDLCLEFDKIPKINSDILESPTYYWVNGFIYLTISDENHKEDLNDFFIFNENENGIKCKKSNLNLLKQNIIPNELINNLNTKV